MGRQTGVLGDSGPAVLQDLHTGTAGIHHRFDREHHALGQARTASRLAVVRYLRLLVQLRSDAVAHELTNHGEPVLLDMLLNRMADVGNPRPRSNGLDGLPE